jgi:hypothetical protein
MKSFRKGSSINVNCFIDGFLLAAIFLFGSLLFWRFFSILWIVYLKNRKCLKFLENQNQYMSKFFCLQELYFQMKK